MREHTYRGHDEHGRMATLMTLAIGNIYLGLQLFSRKKESGVFHRIGIIFSFS